MKIPITGTIAYSKLMPLPITTASTTLSVQGQWWQKGRGSEAEAEAVFKGSGGRNAEAQAVFKGSDGSEAQAVFKGSDGSKAQAQAVFNGTALTIGARKLQISFIHISRHDFCKAPRHCSVVSR